MGRVEPDLGFLAGYQAGLSGMPCRILPDIRLFLVGLPDIRPDNPALADIRPNPIYLYYLFKVDYDLSIYFFFSA